MIKNKFANFAIFSILVLSLALTSAYTSTQDAIKVTTITELPNPVVPGTNYNVIINVTNNNGTSINLSWADTSATSGITAIIPANDTIADATSKQYTITYSIPSSFTGTVNHKVDLLAYDGSTNIATFHPYSQANYTASTPVSGCTDSTANNYNPLATTDDGSCTYTISEDTLCEIEGYSEKGDLEISDYNIDNLGDGKDDEWQFLDKLEMEIEVENTGDENIEDVEVMMAIYDDKIENGGKDVTNDFDLNDEVLTSIGKLKDGDQETVTFTIEELPADLDDGTYYMYVMAYEDGNEEVNCNSEIDSGDFYFEFTIESVDYEDSIVIKGPEFEDQINTQCGEESLEIKVPVYNLGTDKEERVLVNLYNTELNIDEYIVIKDLNDGDKELLSFFINIPSELTKEKYTLDAIVSFDWDSDKDDEVETSYDEENTDSSVRLNILGCTNVQAPTVSASLDSATEVGTELVVKTIIKNNGDATNFIVSPTGFESWADLVGTNPGSVEIASGETREVMITLSPKEAGSKTFSIKILANGEIYNQPVSVNIKEEPGMFSGLGLSNAMLYLVIGIVVLLVIIFLVLIIRLLQRPRRSSEF